MSYHNSVFGTFLLFVGRVFMSIIFILAGIMKIADFNQTVMTMSGMGIPLGEFALVIAIILELGGGLLLLFGWYTRFSALLLLIFVVLVTYFFHSFWDYQGAAQIHNIYHFFKNLFMFGALLYVFVEGAGKFSFDRCFRKIDKE